MNCLSGNTILLAIENPITAMGRHFRKDSVNIGAWDVVILLTVIAVIAGTLWLVARLWYWDRYRAYTSPRALFNELCRAHRLTSIDRRLLADLALQHGVQPMHLFMSPERFEVQRLSKQLQPRATEIRTLAERLFELPAQK